MGFAQLGREEALYQGAYHAYADNEIGRVIQAVEDLDELDNTLIIYIGGDNGASAEGMLNGMPNELTTFNGVAAGQGPGLHVPPGALPGRPLIVCWQRYLE